MTELPQNWIECEFEKCIEKINTRNKVKQKEYLEKGLFPVIDQGHNLIGGYSNNKEYVISIKSPVVIFGDHTRCFKYIDFDFIAGADGTKILKPISCFNEKLFYYFCKVIELPNKGYSRHFQYLLKSRINVPPLNEQKRIVNKLDAIIPKVDEVNARLDRVPLILKRARQSILNQAITGELTKDWRKGHNINTPWEETTINSIVLSYKNGLSKRSGKEGKETVVLRLADLCNHKIIRDNIREIKITENEAQQYKLDYNDMLVIRVNGSEDIVGRFILYDINEDWIYCDHLIRLKYDTTKIDPYYLYFYAQTNIVREYIKANMVSSAGQNTINQGTIDNIPLMLPKLEEQEEIVRRVKKIFEKLDKVEERYKKAKSYTDKVTQSILHKAFTGNLLPQDPNDKPIELL